MRCGGADLRAVGGMRRSCAGRAYADGYGCAHADADGYRSSAAHGDARRDGYARAYIHAAADGYCSAYIRANANVRF